MALRRASRGTDNETQSAIRSANEAESHQKFKHMSRIGAETEMQKPTTESEPTEMQKAEKSSWPN